MSESESRRKPTLGTKILLGVLAGIAVGVFLGDYAAPFDVVGKIYVGLLQMTVLPYVVVSLISKIGGFTRQKAARLAGRASLALVALWVLALATVVIVPLSLPDWQAGSFFSSSLVEEPQEIDFLELYLPINIFRSLANSIVPAAVLFSILIGIALIAMPNKAVLLDPLNAFSDALGRISGAIVKLAPWGTFALAASAAGELSPGELMRLAGYVASYTFAILLLTLVVFPGFVAAFTPFGMGTILGKSRSALLTAFATGKLFAVLPMVMEAVRDLLVGRDLPAEEANATADVLVPLAYPFPNAGKVLILLFIPFAAWYVGEPLGIGDYPMLLSVGLLSMFGSPVAAIPFLLEMMRLPADLLAIFLVAGIWCARLGDVLGAMHLTAFSVLTASAERGWVRPRPAKSVMWLGLSALVGFATLAANHFVVKESVAGEPPPINRVVAMELLDELTPIREGEGRPNPVPLLEGESLGDRIFRAGELRVGYLPGNPPFCYRNEAGKLVGFDIDLVQRLAWDMEVSLRLVPYQPGRLGEALRADHFDLAVGGIPSSVKNLGEFDESEPYLDLHAALVVSDHRVEEFRTLSAILEQRQLRVAYLAGGLKLRTGLHMEAEYAYVEVPSARAFMEAEKRGEVDCLLTEAETGAIYTMIAPEYSVVIPEGLTPVLVPVVFAHVPTPETEEYLNRWIRIKRADGTIDALYRHWILGKTAAKKEPRWSLIRDVLGWVD